MSLEYETVRLTDKFHSYRVGGGPQYNAGELVRVPTAEADVLVAAGAAVRHVVTTQEDSAHGKAPARPIKDKMVTHAVTK
jgi:hypothetical protein